MISHFDDTEDALRQKRLKISSACSECRRRKSNCDGGQPCANCNIAKAECQYMSSNKVSMNNKIQQKPATITVAPASSNPTTTNTITFAAGESKQYRQYPQLIKPRRFSSNLQPIAIHPNSLPPTTTTYILPSTPPTIISPRQSISRPTGPRASISQKQSRPPPPIIASIEQRLGKIERLLRMILDKSYSHSNRTTIIIKEEEPDPDTTTSSPPPLYHQHHYHHYYHYSSPTTSTCSGSTNTSPFKTTLTPLPTRSSPDSTSPVTNASHSPHDPAAAAAPTVQHFLQPNNNNTSVAMVSSRRPIIQPSSSSVPSPHTPSSNDHYLNSP